MSSSKKRRELEPGTFVRFPAAIAYDRRVGATVMRVLIYIADKGDDAYPSAETIAADLQMHERTVRDAIDKARALGYLTARPRIVPGKGFKGYFFNLVYPEPGAGRPPGRSPDPGAGNSSGRQQRPGCGQTRAAGAGKHVEPGAGKPPDEPESLNQIHGTRVGADADAPFGSGGGVRDNEELAGKATDAARARERSRALTPAPDSRSEGHGPMPGERAVPPEHDVDGDLAGHPPQEGPPMTLDQALAEIVEAFDERRCDCKTTLDRVAVLISERTGRSYAEVRMGYVRGWAARLQEVFNSSDRRTTVELLDLVIMGPHLQPTWGLLSAIDTAVNEYVRLQQTEEWWAMPRYRVVPTHFEPLTR